MLSSECIAHLQVNHPPKITVVVPACNAGHTLDACLKSVLAQTHTSWELIVIDDGSTDHTETVARKYSTERVRYIFQENQGAGSARSVGMKLARGELIALLDADDSWSETFLEQTVAFLDSHPNAAAVSTGFIVRTMSSSTEIRPACIGPSGTLREPFVIENFFEFWATYDHIHTSGVVLRKSLVEIAGYMRDDLRISQDLEYFGYIATFGKWGIIPEPLSINNSRMAGALVGWTRKYRKRRQMCPSVEAWQARIASRLGGVEIRDFEIVRGRVAAGYAHAMILGGNAKEALRVIDRYGETMPRNRLTRLLTFAARSGALPWFMACLFITARERIKSAAFFLIARARRAGLHGSVP